MIQNKQNEQLIMIGNWISPKVERYEPFFLLILVVELLVKILTNRPTGNVISLALVTLSMMYFFKTFSFREDENAGGMERFFEKITAISASIGIMGILFSIQRWPGGDMMLICGCGTLLISLPIIFYFKSRKPELKIFTTRMILRTLIIGALGLALYFIPIDTLKKSGLVKDVNIERAE
jgi:hypothetical protein